MLLPPAPRDLDADTWVATDGLGRSLPMAPRAPRGDRFVGIFYFLWHGFHGTPGPYDLSEILKAERPEYGPVSAFHWWGEPEVGYFRSDDPWIARRNLGMLADAGIDALFLDATNAFTYPVETKLLFDTAARLRAQGERTPRIAFVLNARVQETAQRLWAEVYRDGRYRDILFPWLGKPLMLADPAEVPQSLRPFFTLRRSWFETDPKGWFGNGRDKWPWRDRTPQNFGWHDDPKLPEEVAVGVASHPTNGIGRSYHDGEEPANPDFRQGLQFQEQWNRALALDPKLVFVTGWNEWVAQRFTVAPGQRIDLAGKPLKTGDTFFVDLYSPEFSRDIDPMKGGYGDDYYYQLVANVRRYKGARPVPRASAPKTIRIDGPFAQWAGVGPEYRDAAGDTMHRDWPGWGSLRYKDDSGRNDIVVAKVARDPKRLAFYVRTAAPLTSASDPDWMVLYLDTDRNARTGWHGYEFRVAGGRVERWRGGWEPVAKASMRVRGAEMQLSIPRKPVGSTFDFKWADHSGDDGLFVHGDAAPPRRFNYRYSP